MAEIPTWVLVHRVTVRPHLGQTSVGDAYGPEFEMPCWCRRKKRLVGTAETGQSQVLESVLRAPLSFLSRVPVESIIRLPDGTEGVVSLVSEQSDGGFGGWQHAKIEVY